jgi:hypothetical protein
MATTAGYHAVKRLCGQYRRWRPLWPLDGDESPPRVQPADLDYSKLANLCHGGDMIPFGSLSSLVYDQLAARAERVAKLFLAEERQRLGYSPPAWRYGLSQDLKDRVLNTVADDALEASVYSEAAVPTAETPLATAPLTALMNSMGRGVGGADAAAAAARLERKHLQVLQPLCSGRALLGYLLRVPFTDGMFAKVDGAVGPIEVRDPVMCGHLTCVYSRTVTHFSERLDSVQNVDKWAVCEPSSAVC